MKKERNSDDSGTDQPNNFGRKIIMWVISLLIILAAAVAVMSHHYVKTALKPLNKNNSSKIEVNIPMGASNRRIGSILQTDNVIKSGFVFDYYAHSHNISNFRSGYYRLSQSMTLGQIANHLKMGGATQPFSAIKDKIVVKDGDRVEDISDIVASRSNLSKHRFLALVNDKKFNKELRHRYPKLFSSAVNVKKIRYRLEGYLAPGVYNSKGLNEEQLITKMVAKTNAELKPNYKKIRKDGLSVHEMLTLASFIDNESLSYSNKRIISGIFYNRLNNNLNLDSKSALNYALRSNNDKFSSKQYNFNSPYNLFINLGTGAGPIGSPSLESIRAIIHPAEQSKGYLYYLYNPKNKKLYYSINYIAQ